MTSSDEPGPGASRATSETIAVVEETAEVQRRDVTTGHVRIVTTTDSVTETVEAALEAVQARVTRVPVDRQVEAGAPLPQTRIEGDRTIIPVLEEVLVVETRILLKEEIHIELQRAVERVAVPVSLRKQKADVERLPEPRPADPDPQT